MGRAAWVGLFTLGALAVGACATAATAVYRPASREGEPGYQDEWVKLDIVKVTATGGPRVPVPDVCEVALLRAAHLALEHGRDYFVVIRQDGDLAPFGLRKVDWDQWTCLVAGGIPLCVPALGEDEQPVCRLWVRLWPPWRDPPLYPVDAHRVVEQLGPTLER
jgi:hypothetical protein